MNPDHAQWTAGNTNIPHPSQLQMGSGGAPFQAGAHTSYHMKSPFGHSPVGLAKLEDKYNIEGVYRNPMRHSSMDLNYDSQNQHSVRKNFSWKTIPESEKYNGKERFEDWLNRFEIFCHCNGCRNLDEKADALLLALKGDASNYILSLPNCTDMTYPYLCACLQDRFGAARNVANDERKLLARQKTKDESWQHLADDILRLCTNVYGADQVLVARKAKQHFLKSLPLDIRRTIAGANPATLNDCVLNLEELSTVVDVDNHKYLKVNLATENKENIPPSFSNGQNARTNRDGFRNRRRDLSQVICYRCEKPGHYARDCSLPPTKSFKPKSSNGTVALVEEDQENSQESQ
jgi:hypothetical protein